MARVLILGGGFAAISAAETLVAAAGGEHEIMLVSNSPDFTFFPAIIPMIFGDFQPAEITFGLSGMLAENGIQFLRGEVREIDTNDKTVDVVSDQKSFSISYDFLIVAVGRRIAPTHLPGLSHAHHLLTVDAAIKFKNAIAGFEEGSIVVGLCPDASLPVPMCETALALARRFRKQMERGDVTLDVVIPTTLESAFAGTALFRDVEGQFDREGIGLVSDFALTEVREGRIFSSVGASLKYDLLMLIPPFGGQLSVLSPGPGTDASGFAKVNSLLQITGVERVYAAGESVAIPGPKFGYMAIRQGKVAALNILAELKGANPATEYIHKPAWAIAEKYTDPVFFHYGFWDETLEDFDENALFGMARKIRDRYGRVKISEAENYFASA